MMSVQSVAAANAVRMPTPTKGTAAASLSRRGRCSGARPARLSVVSDLGDCKRTGIVEQLSSGGFTAEYSFDLGGPSAAHQTFTFHANAEVLPLSIERPLGIVFEEKEVDGVKLCVAVEVLEGSNAAAAGVNVGDVLKCTTAVFTVKGKVDVTTWMNPPRNANVLAFLPTDGKRFEEVMAAIQSHTQLIDTPRGKTEVDRVTLLLERVPSSSVSVSK